MTTLHRGDARRTALLESLDEILREQPLDEASLDSINIAEISRRAGVTRSAFYFYFENKQAAVAALMEEMYDQAFAATGELSGDATPQDNIAATITGLFDAWESHQHVFRAMLDAKATSAAVRQLWDSDRHSFIAPVAQMIEAERASGRAPSGSDATGVAAVLLDLNDRMLERLALGGPLSRAQIQEAVVEIWLRTIYGRTTP